MERTRVFISYSQKDEVWKDRLMRHLMVLEREGLFHIWADNRIELGEAWKPQIDREMAASRVAVLVVTANFLTSDFVRANELPLLRHSTKRKA